MNQKLLKVALAQKSLSQIALANRLKIHPSTLNRYVKGWLPVPQNIQIRISRMLNVSPSHLFHWRSIQEVFSEVQLDKGNVEKGKDQEQAQELISTIYLGPTLSLRN